MLPSPILELISSHLDAMDRARFSCVCRNFRNIGMRQSSIRAIVPSNKNTILSFAKWLSMRLKYVEHLELVTDMTMWSYVWRFSGVKIAIKLKFAHLYHRAESTLIIHSPEDVLPTSPFLEHLMVCAPGSLYLGSGISRLRLKYLTVHSTTGFITAEILTFTIPTLEKLFLHGNLSETMSLSGLVSSKRLRHIECPAILLTTVIPSLVHLESLVLYGGGLPCNLLRSQIKLSSSLKFLRLVQGHWCNLSWIPENLETLECVSCNRVNRIPTARIKHLLLLSTQLDVHSARDISKMNLESFALRSFSVCLPVIPVRARRYNVPKEDLRYIKFLN